MILHTIYHVNDKGEIEEGIALSEVLLDNETRLGFGDHSKGRLALDGDAARVAG